jgi:hypothetical protein
VRIEYFLNNVQAMKKWGRISYQIDMIKIQHWISRRAELSQSRSSEFSLCFWNAMRATDGERQKFVFWHCASNAGWNIESRQSRIIDQSYCTIFARWVRYHEYAYLSN